MKDSINNILIGFVLALFLLAGVWGGYKLYPSLNPCPVPVTETVYVYDTVEHHIPDTIPWYVIKRDTVIYHDTVFINADTAGILKDYYADHYYTRYWQDSLMHVTQHDVLSENRFKESEFTYRLLKPVAVTHNTFNFYRRYITAGADMPFRSMKHLNLNLEIVYVTEKWYAGIGYNSELNCPTIKGGATIMQFH